MHPKELPTEKKVSLLMGRNLPGSQVLSSLTNKKMFEFKIIAFTKEIVKQDT